MSNHPEEIPKTSRSEAITEETTKETQDTAKELRLMAGLQFQSDTCSWMLDG